MVGAAVALDLFWLPLIPLFVLFTISSQLRFILAFTLGLAVFLWTGERYQFPSDDVIGKAGIAEVEITSISASKTFFGSDVWRYEAVLSRFFDDQGTLVAKNIPVRILLPADKSDRPLASHHYRLQGKIKINDSGRYKLAPLSGAVWTPIQPAWNLAEWRFMAKSWLRQQIQNAMNSYHVGSFLSGIATGEFDDSLLSNQLGRFGLQHLMAISGLHFSILASILGVGFSLIFSSRTSAVAVILILSSYFIFLGASSSVMRAWISLTIALCGVLSGKRSFAMNSLGVAIAITVLIDSLVIRQVGFQFSFGITAAILLLFGPCDAIFLKVFKKRSLSQAVLFDWIDQHVYCMLSFLRQALALTLAVNLVALPMTLFYFQQFPLMGLVYNLFFPCMVSVSMFLLLMALLLAPLFPLLGNALHFLNGHYTQFLLNFTFNLPKAFDANLYVADVSSTVVLCYLFVLFTAAICANHFSSRRDNTPSWMV